MFKLNKCDCSQKNDRMLKLLEEHEKQHTKEHWLVIGLLAVLIALEVAAYVV